MIMSERLIVLSAGGTGGHVMPAQALARDLRSRGFKVEVLTDARGMKFKEGFDCIPLHEIRAGTLGPSALGKLKGLARMGLGIWQARALLSRLRPSVVVGFGGYPSVPGVYAAQLLGIPTILHEQNAIMGRANAMLARKAAHIAISMPYIRGAKQGGQPEKDQKKTVYTGNPVRAEISALYNRPYPALDDAGCLRVLVMGGSLGASVFSRVLPEALAKLPSDHRARLHIVQQCRAEDMDRVKDLYAQAGIKARLETFISDVAGEMEQAHLVIARSGASTVAEVTTAGRPAIFVPYPHHKDQQQKINADTVADAGGAWVMTENGFTAEALLARIETFLQNPSLLFKAAENARSCGKPDAARKLGNLVTAVVSGWSE
ncbi:MAG: undecaprenyldiphospho-muramoylpentapeptide beta-N-acetylglucosaminyltransferase [Alphaproteobacteria bacterium]|nr:undecaprenyldiphospho-muramoylpentapeptide beta-N-acetylglucosaminyltransferase [Alphaproteobacteria bacterium]